MRDEECPICKKEWREKVICHYCGYEKKEEGTIGEMLITLFIFFLIVVIITIAVWDAQYKGGITTLSYWEWSYEGAKMLLIEFGRTIKNLTK